MLGPLSCNNGEGARRKPHPVNIFFLPDPKFPRDSLNLCLKYEPGSNRAAAGARLVSGQEQTPNSSESGPIVPKIFPRLITHRPGAEVKAMIVRLDPPNKAAMGGGNRGCLQHHIRLMESGAK